MKVSFRTRISNPAFQFTQSVDLPQKPISIASSPRASSRRMAHQLALPMRARAVKWHTPTERFMRTHPVYKINETLIRFGMTDKDLDVCKTMIAAEDDQFDGYHAGSSTVRLFQDMINIVVQDMLGIPIKDDCVFTRIPGDT